MDDLKYIILVYRSQIHILNACITFIIVLKKCSFPMSSRLKLNIWYKNKYLRDLVYFKKERTKIYYKKKKPLFSSKVIKLRYLELNNA